MAYDWIKFDIKNIKGSAIENHVSEFFIKSPIFCFTKIYNKSSGVFGIVSPYLTSHILNFILYSTYNSYNGGKKYLNYQFIYS
jgi:hypothetical protein